MRIRSARDGDLPGLIELYRETVHAVGAAHYTRQELAAGASGSRTSRWKRS